MTEEWENFFVVQVGAAAEILGLLFVPLSLNLSRILWLPLFPNRAQLVFLLLFAVPITALLVLVPDQPLWLFGIKTMAIGLFISVAGILIGLQTYRHAESHRRAAVANILFSQLCSGPYPVAALLLFAGRTNAFYWIAGAMILSFVKAVIGAWVLLVEINR